MASSATEPRADRRHGRLLHDLEERRPRGWYRWMSGLPSNAEINRRQPVQGPGRSRVRATPSRKTSMKRSEQEDELWCRTASIPARTWGCPRGWTGSLRRRGDRGLFGEPVTSIDRVNRYHRFERPVRAQDDRPGRAPGRRRGNRQGAADPWRRGRGCAPRRATSRPRSARRSWAPRSRPARHSLPDRLDHQDHDRRADRAARPGRQAEVQRSGVEVRTGRAQRREHHRRRAFEDAQRPVRLHRRSRVCGRRWMPTRRRPGHRRRCWHIAFRHPPQFAPDTSYDYSNTNYALLGLVAEKVGGRRWRSSFQDRCSVRSGSRRRRSRPPRTSPCRLPTRTATCTAAPRTHSPTSRIRLTCRPRRRPERCSRSTTPTRTPPTPRGRGSDLDRRRTRHLDPSAG